MKKLFASLAVLFLLSGCNNEVPTPIATQEKEVKIIPSVAKLSRCVMINTMYRTSSCDIIVEITDTSVGFEPLKGTYQFKNIRVKPVPIADGDIVMLIQNKANEISVFEVRGKTLD